MIPGRKPGSRRPAVRAPVRPHPGDPEENGGQGTIKITLKYNDKEQVIKGLRRVSKPGLRVYVGAEDLPRVLKGLGVAIISTSKGVMTDKKARAANIGGEVLAFIW